MSQSQDNLMALAGAVRHDRKLLAKVCATAKALKLPSPKRQQKQPSAAAARLQNYVRKFNPADLQNAIAKHGARGVSNHLTCKSILETAAAKFAEMAIEKAGCSQ